MDLLIFWVAVPVSVLAILVFCYFLLYSRTNEIYEPSPDTVARLLDYLDTLYPYLNKKKLDEHDGAFMEDVVNRILDVDDGSLPFLSEDEEKVLSEFAYKGHDLTLVFRQTVQELMLRVKRMSKEMDLHAITGYGYHR